MGVVGGWVDARRGKSGIYDIKDSIKRERRRRKQTNTQQNACSSSLVHAPNKKGKCNKNQEHYQKKGRRDGASWPKPWAREGALLLVCGWSSAERTKSGINVDRCVMADKRTVEEGDVRPKYKLTEVIHLFKRSSCER